MLSLNLSLLLGNIVIEYISKEKSVPPKKISNTNIDSLLINELYENGIKQEWIDERKTQRKNSCYNVTVPGDLSITSLLRNLNHTLQGNDLKFSTIELVENGKTKFEFFENNGNKFIYYFFYDDLLKRESAELSFLINISDDEELISELFNSAVPLTFLIRPSENSDGLIKKISNTTHQYFVMLDDKIEEKKYYLDLAYSKLRLKAVIEEICESFVECKYFVLDKNSKLARSTLINFLKEEFSKRKRRIIYLDEFKEITESTILVKSKFNYFLNNKNEQHKIVIYDFDFISLKNDIAKSLKRGDKYLSMANLF